MKPQGLFGIILIIVGVVLLAYQGFSYTKTTKVVDAGPLQVNAETTHMVPIPPIIGAVCVIAGIFVTVMGTRRG